MAILIAYIAFIFANITWSVAPLTEHSQKTNKVNNSANLTGNQQTKFIDVAKIQALHLFGFYDETEETTPEVEMSNVPETTLNLILSGLVASDNKNIAAAIIENKGKQETYGIGETINGTRANLEQVLMDRVLIKQSGRLETLMLDGFDYNQPAKEVAKRPETSDPSKVNDNLRRSDVVDHRRNKQLTDTAKNLRSELSNDPTKISDYLRISPKRKSGQIVGYSLRPGKNPEFFKLAGLKNGDIAVQMNGFDLVEPAQAMQAMAEMKKARDISLLVDRQGSLTEILVSLE
jgi:general secretion pathway protein C